MRFKLLTVSLLSTTLILTACGQHDNSELKNNDSEKSENKENSNNKTEVIRIKTTEIASNKIKSLLEMQNKSFMTIT